MKISNIRIKNFKTFDETGIELSMSNLTAMVGENSVGKSNVLEALDLFFNFSKSKVSIKSFHHNDYLKKIEIELTLIELSEIEKKVFKSHLNDSQNLIITQYIISVTKEEDIELEKAAEDEIDFVESKHGTKIQATSDYEWASLNDKLPGKTNIKNWWKQELKLGDFNFKSYFDSDDVPSQEEYQEKLEKLWEEKTELIPTESITGDEKVLGWKSKLKANLPIFFYIPAIKNVADDLKVTSTSPLGEMIKWLSTSVSREIKDEFKEKSAVLVDELLTKIDKDDDGISKIQSLNNALNKNIGLNIGCELELRFGTPEIQDIIFPEPKIFANDGYDSELTQKGHGIQRLAIFSLLRTYNTFLFKKDRPIRNIIIGIEEPEIYLHPPVKRSTYRLLREISKDQDQVIYTTHDNFFVSVEHYDEIKLFRKEGKEKPKTSVYEFSVSQLKDFYSKHFQLEIDEKSIKDRYCHILDENKNEGFFAKKIILIEGQTEKYALPNYFFAKGFDLDNNCISLISAGSVDCLSYLYVIFNEFHIPCYIIFDGDKPKNDKPEDLPEKKRNDAINKSKRNKELYSILGLESTDNDYFFPDTFVGNQHAVWIHDFEYEFHKTLDNYEELKSSARALYKNDSKPLTARYISERIVNESPEKINNKIDTLIQNIKKLEWTHSIL
ncbi:MAG: AAA family ATPase [Candidatus Paceibacterota bacterium]|jgi:predicted ATP-dependent endonuclease of OLD family